MHLKDFIPFDNYTLLTKLSINEVQERIENSIEPKKTFRLAFFTKKRAKPYEGKIMDRDFEINRIIYYRNSFLPIIKGQISSYLGQTEIYIKMRPFISVLIFMALWLGIVGLVCVSILVAAVFQLRQVFQHGFSLIIFIPFIMFIFGYGLLIGAYKAESKKSKDFLNELLEGHEK